MRIGINMLFLVAGAGGGIERYTRGLISGFGQVDNRNEYILFTNRHCRGTIPLRDNFREVPCPASGTLRPAKLLWEQTLLPLALKREKIDVLLSLGNIAPAIHYCPSVAVIHDIIPFAHPEIFTVPELLALKVLFRATAKASSRIITVSQSSKKDIIRILNVGEEKVDTVYAGCEDFFTPASQSEGRRELGIAKPYILSVASTRAYKNIDGLIKAYKILKERYFVSQSLVISGHAGKAQSALEQLVDRLGLAGNVIFTGFVEDRNLALLYSAADLFVYPSLYEGFGLPILEAMACGTPVAASNASAISEAAGDAGVLFDPLNIQDIADKVYRVLTDSSFRESLVHKGLARAKTFSWEKAASETLAVLREVAAGGKRR